MTANFSEIRELLHRQLNNHYNYQNILQMLVNEFVMIEKHEWLRLQKEHIKFEYIESLGQLYLESGIEQIDYRYESQSLKDVDNSIILNPQFTDLESSNQYAWRLQERLLQQIELIEELESICTECITSLLDQLYNSPWQSINGSQPSDQDLAANRKKIENKAMWRVMRTEIDLGYIPEDVSVQNLGYDIVSRTLNKRTDPRYIEVKGRADDSDDNLTLSYNEVNATVTNKEKFILAIVIVQDGKPLMPRYLRNRNHQFYTPDPMAKSITFNLNALLELSEEPS